MKPTEFIAAIVKPMTKKWKRSVYSVAYYTASPVKLEPPIIRANAPQFDWDINDTIYVSFDNPIDSDVSEIEFRVNGGDWETYNDRSKRFKERQCARGRTE